MQLFTYPECRNAEIAPIPDSCNKTEETEVACNQKKKKKKHELRKAKLPREIARMINDLWTREWKLKIDRKWSLFSPSCPNPNYQTLKVNIKMFVSNECSKLLTVSNRHCPWFRVTYPKELLNSMVIIMAGNTRRTDSKINLEVISMN